MEKLGRLEQIEAMVGDFKLVQDGLLNDYL